MPAMSRGYTPHRVLSMQTPPKSKEEEVEENIRQSVNFARDVFKIATDKKYVEATTAKTRYEELCKRYPEFAKAYPVCVHNIANGRYQEKAFLRFLHRQRDNPGKGMEGFIERQADYAMFLYEEEERSNRRHVNRKKAAQIWQYEYKSLKKWMNSIKKDEEDAKNQFEEEQKAHLDARRKEFLDFLNTEAPPDPVSGLAVPNLDSYREPENTEGMAPLSEVAPSLVDVDTSKMPWEEFQNFYKDIEKYYEELIDSMTQMNERIHHLEQLEEIKQKSLQPLPEDLSSEASTEMRPKTKSKTKVSAAARAAARRKADAEIQALLEQHGLIDKRPVVKRKAQRAG